MSTHHTPGRVLPTCLLTNLPAYLPARWIARLCTPPRLVLCLHPCSTRSPSLSFPGTSLALPARPPACLLPPSVAPGLATAYTPPVFRATPYSVDLNHPTMYAGTATFKE